ncbi:S-adenosylmethionine decarboxylase [Polaribacter vadi]|uniref:S-adenosylmethionine decarboxylase n=1 Tax=Polaribacter TaxID=52959 RepID=UPI001C09B507|nr:MULTISPECIES: S-adenosylmethionine decarboxylase [Polaribacter]MBU3012955.1 S-adenosylmethionine decarboxylase [Polaribacter vadi]MDO6742773.1 S-adenosylmethionine decarboxylase [Polaribacter sp. 1_MG-2023]
MKEKYVSLKAEMFHFEKWISITNPETLKSNFNDFLVNSGFTIVNFTEHYFPIKGYTCVWVLAESHLAIHTFPQKNTSYIQISSCNLEKLEHFKTVLKNIKI